MADHNIDSLNIKITSDARSANNALNTLEKHLNSLAGSLNNLGAQSSGLSKFSAGVTELSTAMVNFKNSGIGTADFTRLVKNLGQLSTIDHAGIEATASSLDKLGQSMGNISVLSENASKVTEFTKAMSSLGRKGVSEAINNLPRLTDAFRELLITLNETPEIRQDVLSMTQALAEFVSGAKGYVNQAKSMQTANARIKISVGYADEVLKKFAETAKRAFKFLVTSPFKAFASGAKTLASGLQSCVGKLKTFATHSERAEKTASKFAQTVGTLYVKFWLLARVMGKLWSSVKSSFDYLETVNYFSSSFEAIAKKATSTLSDAGEESAQAFYKSFTDTATTLTRKMSGFDISGGQLTMTKGSNLGLDPNTTLNYQTTFAQIASSMGVASDKAVMLSNVLTEIGADLASVKNMDFEEVWQNMASGLVGMSRAVDKFGINIRTAAMNEKLADLGIQATVKDLSQADKALLRTIMILDASKYAWGDLADTLDTPANQIRMLTANLHKLATMFGSLFLPILKKVLPYINALVIALQRLMQTLMNVFGIDLSEMLPKGGAGASDALSDVLDDAEGTGDALEDAADEAKKLKNNLLGIDELNILNDNSDALTVDDLTADSLLDQAFIDAISEYQAAWDEAFKKLENKAQEIADKIVEWAKKVWKPIGEAWDAVGDYVIEKWKYMAGELGKLFKSIASDWAEVWAQDKTEKIFENIFKSVGNIFEFVGNLARQFRLAWDEADKGKRILETVRDIILKVSEHVEKMTASWAKWAGELNFNPILESMLGLLTSVRNVADDVLGIFDDWQEIFLQPAFTYIVEEFLPKLFDIASKLVSGIDWGKLREELAKIFDALERIGEVIGNTLLKALDKLADVVIKFVNGHYFQNLATDFQKLASALENAKDINDVINAIFDFGEGRIVDASQIINGITNAFNEAFDKIDFKNLGKRLGDLVNKIFETLDWKSLGKAVSNIASGFFELIHGALKEIKWFEVGQAIGNFLKGIEWGKIIKEVLSAIGDVLGGLISAWLGSALSAPLETGIVTAILAVVGGGKLYSVISKATGGKGLMGDILTKLFGGNKDMGEEVTLFDKITGSAEKASKSKGLFADANGRVADSAEDSIGKLATESGKFAGVSGAIGGFLKKLGGIGLIAGGVVGAGMEFGKQWEEGVTLADVALTGLFTLMGAIGAILLGAPAGIALAVAGGVLAIGEGIMLIHEHWDDICDWWNNTVVPAVSGFLEGIGEKFRGFTEGIGEKWDELKTNLSTKWQEIKDGFSTFVGEWGQKITEWASTKWEEITNKIEEVRNNIKMKWDEMKQNFSDHITEWRTKISEWASTKWEDITTKVEEIRKGIEDKWTEMRENFQTHIEGWREKIELWASEKWDAVQDKVEEVRDYIERKWGEMKQAFEEHIKYWKDSLVEWAQQKWDDITTTMDNIKTAINDRWELMKQDFDDFKERWREKIGEWAQEKWDDIVTAMQTLRDDIQRKWEDFKKDFSAFIEEWHRKIGEWAQEKWDTVVETLETLKKGIGEKWENIKTDAQTFWDNFKTDLGDWAEKASTSVENGFKKLKDGLGGIWDNLKETAGRAFDNIKDKAEGLWDKVKGVGNNLVDKFSNIGSSKTNSSLYTTANKSIVTSAITNTVETVTTGISNTWKKLTGQKYATGGFPEDGLFFANHNELVGQFSNGRTAVANNAQITAGIEQATYNAMMRANSQSSNREEQLLEELINAVRQGSKISIDGREIVTAYDNRKARNGYSFA